MFKNLRRKCKPAGVMALIVFSLQSGGAAAFQPANPRGMNPRKVEEDKVAFDQKLGQRLSENLPFANERGQRVDLRLLAAERPLILILAYYDCPSLCTLVLNGAFQTLQAMPYQAGRDYELAVVSIDPKEGPELAAQKKIAYSRRYPGLGEPDAFHFLTGDQATITTLAEDVGFRYRYDPETEEFVHPGGLLIVTGKGLISRYLFGIQFPERDVRLALVDASKGRIGQAIDRFLLYCYRYDAQSGSYSLAIHLIIQILAGLTALALALLIAGLLRIERKAASLKGGSL